MNARRHSRYIDPHQARMVGYDKQAASRRRTKLARGMSRNAKRSAESVTLSVRGTLDELGRYIWFTERTKKVCHCCGQRMVQLKLNDRGRQRLARLKKKRAA